jgi:hypothetical protein
MPQVEQRMAQITARTLVTDHAARQAIAAAQIDAGETGFAASNQIWRYSYLDDPAVSVFR